MSDDLVIGDLVRIHSIDQLGRNLEGMTGILTNASPLYADVALTCWPGVTVMVLRETLTLVNPRPAAVPEPDPATEPVVNPAHVVKWNPKPRRKAPRIAIAPAETIYPPVVEPEPRPLSRLREKLRGIA